MYHPTLNCGRFEEDVWIFSDIFEDFYGMKNM